MQFSCPPKKNAVTFLFDTSITHYAPGIMPLPILQINTCIGFQKKLKNKQIGSFSPFCIVRICYFIIMIIFDQISKVNPDWSHTRGVMKNRRVRVHFASQKATRQGCKAEKVYPSRVQNIYASTPSFYSTGKCVHFVRNSLLHSYLG